MRSLAAVVLAVLLVFAGCLGRSYADVLKVHLDVLTAMADKLCALARDGRPPTTEGMPEFVYPLKRGQQFLGYFEGDSQRDSYHSFQALLARYEATVRLAEGSRADTAAWRDRADQICAGRDEVRGLAGEVATALNQGR